MDIVEALLSLSSATLDSIISTANRYSKDSHFTEEGREYYREFGEAITMAKENLEEYKKKRETSAFRKLNENTSTNSKLTEYRNNIDSARTFALVEMFFSSYRGVDGFYFFDEHPNGQWQEDLIESIEYNNYLQNVTPIMGLTSPNKTGLVFFAEGILALDVKNGCTNVFPYEVFSKICWSKSKALFSSEETLYLELQNETGSIISLQSALKTKRESELAERYDTLYKNVIPDFLKCFGANCKIVNSR